MSTYPEHERMAAVVRDSHVIGDFLTDRDEAGIKLARWDDEAGEFLPFTRTIEEHLADYFDIDLAKIETERQAMLANLREETP